MKRLSILLVLVFVASSCARDPMCGLGDRPLARVSVEDVSTAAIGSGCDRSEEPTAIEILGGRLLEITYWKYRGWGLGEEDIGRLPPSAFRDNLGRLYGDLRSVLEE